MTATLVKSPIQTHLANPAGAATVARNVKRWRVREVQKLFDSGLLDGTRYELLEGQLVEKGAQGTAHGDVVIVFIETLGNLFGFRHIQTQRQVDIGQQDEFNDPEPDVAVLLRPLRTYKYGSIVPRDDVLLAVEIGVTTLADDLGFKAKMYARHDVREVWVADVANRRVVVHRKPTAAGYDSIETLYPNGSISPVAAPDKTISIGDLLPDTEAIN